MFLNKVLKSIEAIHVNNLKNLFLLLFSNLMLCWRECILFLSFIFNFSHLIKQLIWSLWTRLWSTLGKVWYLAFLTLLDLLEVPVFRQFSRISFIPILVNLTGKIWKLRKRWLAHAVNILNIGKESETASEWNDSSSMQSILYTYIVYGRYDT